MSSKTLSRAQYEARTSELEEAERIAVDAHSQAAFAEEIGEGSAEETRKAKAVVEATREKRETLRLAFNKSQEEQVERRKDVAREAHAAFVKTTKADLAKRGKLVEEIIELSSKLGEKFKAHADIQNKIGRIGHNFVRDHRPDAPGFGATDGLQRTLALGHDVRLLVGYVMDKEHGVRLHYAGDRNSYRGEDPQELDAKFAGKVLEQAKMLAPPTGEE